MRLLLSQAVRYFLVGGVVYVVDVGLFLLVQQVFIDHPYAVNIFSKITAAMIGFLLHRNFTFEHIQKKTVLAQGSLYCFLLIANLFMANAIMYIGISGLLLEVVWAKILSDTIVIILTYLISRLIIFK